MRIVTQETNTENVWCTTSGEADKKRHMRSLNGRYRVDKLESTGLEM